METDRNSYLQFEYYSSVKQRKVEWLWYPYIPFGKLTILQGDPGEGKSTFILNYSCTSETASANGCALSDINITDILQSFPPKKGALLPWGSDNF